MISMQAFVSFLQKFSGKRFMDMRISWLMRSTCVSGLKLMGSKIITKRMLTSAKIIEIVPARLELS